MRERVRRFAYRLRVAPLAVALGVQAMVTGVRNLIDPRVLPVHLLLPVFNYAWSAVYALGGLGLVAGLGLGMANIEAAGCALFGGGALVQALAYVAFDHFARTTGWPTPLILFTYAGMALVRLLHLWKGQRQVWLDSPKRDTL